MWFEVRVHPRPGVGGEFRRRKTNDQRLTHASRTAPTARLELSEDPALLGPKHQIDQLNDQSVPLPAPPFRIDHTGAARWAFPRAPRAAGHLDAEPVHIRQNEQRSNARRVRFNEGSI